MNIPRSIYTLLLIAIAQTFLPLMACGADSEAEERADGGAIPKAEKHYSAMKGPGSRVQEYDEIVSPDMESASSIAGRARVALRNGNVSRSLSLAKKAMRMDDDDPDIHAAYAEALEATLERQSEKDPEMFKTCLHEWLIVYRNESGEEKNMTVKGINIMGTWWNDDFRGGLAKIHLKKLTGYLPKAWETDNRYMARVLKPATATVQGKLHAGDETRHKSGSAD
jgi:hypothetical protein